MKKVLFSIAIVAVAATMASCGNSASSRQTEADPATEAEVAESAATTETDELWTVEAAEAQVRKMYDRLNEMDKNGEVSIRKLEDEFCTSHYCNLRNAIYKAMETATGDGQLFFGDEEGYRILAGMPMPLEVENIETDLLKDGMAQAQVIFKGADEENGFMRLELELENDTWRVSNFDQPEVFGPGGYLKMMEDFASEHGISHE